jgi:hypothetical protein
LEYEEKKWTEIALQKWLPEDTYPLFLVFPEDLPTWRTNGEYNTYLDFMSCYREAYPCKAVMVVLINEDYASFAAEKWLVPTLPSLAGSGTPRYLADGVIFATQAEIEQVAAFFTKSAASEAVEHLAVMQLVPNRRLKFFTLSTALGKELTDGEVITPAVTVGTEGARVALAKFKQNAGKKTAFFLTDKEWQPLKDRVIPGRAEVTLIQPAKLLIDLFDSVCKAVTEGEAPAPENDEDDLSWAPWQLSWALFGEECGELDSAQSSSLINKEMTIKKETLIELASNVSASKLHVKALKSEFEEALQRR